MLRQKRVRNGHQHPHNAQESWSVMHLSYIAVVSHLYTCCFVRFMAEKHCYGANEEKGHCLVRTPIHFIHADGSRRVWFSLVCLSIYLHDISINTNVL